MTFDATRTYRELLDVRDWGLWRDRLREDPEGVLWALIGPRRSGKTWALKALESRDADYVNLQTDPNALEMEYGHRCLLVDEPGRILQRARLSFLERCAELKRKGTRVLVAMTPGEWHCIAGLDPEERHVKARDRLTLPLLTYPQAERLARTEWAKQLLPKLPVDWQRNPFLLEFVFEVAEGAPNLRDKIDELISQTIRLSTQERFRYVHYVFEEGLSEPQRGAIRKIARGGGGPGDQPLLGECGLIENGRIADPILFDHFRKPLIIHHISDIHFGPKSASGVDCKEKGEQGKRLAGVAAGATVRDDYLAHIAAHGNATPHAILVSGDLVETGTPDQYQAALEFLGTLSGSLVDHPDLRPNDPRVAVVGGNHDVDWGVARYEEGGRKRHRAFAEHMGAYPRPHLDAPPESRQLSTVVWAGVGVEIALLGSAECGGEPDEMEAQLVQLIEGLVSRARHALEANELEQFDKLSKDISRIDPGLVHHQDLKRLEAHRWTQPVRLAMLHHPVSPMPVGAEIVRFGGLMNAGAVKAALLRAGVCLVVHGHQHCGWFGCESWPGQHDNRKLHIAAAPTLGSRETLDNHGYNEIRIYREGATCYEVQVRRVAYKGNSWDATPDVMSFGLQ